MLCCKGKTQRSDVQSEVQREVSREVQVPQDDVSDDIRGKVRDDIYLFTILALYSSTHTGYACTYQSVLCPTIPP